MHDDLVEREFTAASPNLLWLTDITEHPTAKASSTSARSRTPAQPDRRLLDRRPDDGAARRRGAAERRRAAPPDGTVVHSDRGSQFRSMPSSGRLRKHGLVGSMGRVGACADNAAMESFFSLLQKNVLDRQRWATRDELRLAIITWIERPTTADADNDASADSHPSNMKHSQKPPETLNPKSQPDRGQTREAPGRV